tara:strand:- start:818 stop:976 length:159 start_codon:yes stop_codon:yes gene_type:complete
MKYQQIQNDYEIIKTELARKAHCYWLPSDWKNALLISDLEERIEKLKLKINI